MKLSESTEIFREAVVPILYGVQTPVLGRGSLVRWLPYIHPKSASWC